MFSFLFIRFVGRMRCDSEDSDQQPKSSYWTQQLFNYEANDSGRFVHGGWNFFLHWYRDKYRNLSPLWWLRRSRKSLYTPQENFIGKYSSIKKWYSRMKSKWRRIRGQSKKSSMPMEGLCHMDIFWTHIALTPSFSVTCIGNIFQHAMRWWFERCCQCM